MKTSLQKRPPKSKFKMVIGHKLKVMEIGGSVNYKRNEENEWRGFVMVIERGGKRGMEGREEVVGVTFLFVSMSLKASKGDFLPTPNNGRTINKKTF